MTSTRDKIRRRLRKAIESTAMLLVAWMICRTWFVEGLVVPLSVPSGSMAETLLGPHCRFACANCGQVFACGADVPAPGAWRVCPCCGSVEENTSPLSVLPGDRVLLARPAFFRRSLRRWEIVAFREPDRPSRLTVKRVVGLPGESVEIRDGDVYINGQIARKPLDLQQEMAVPVDQASAGGSGRGAVESAWRPLAAESRWTASDKGFVHPQAALSGEHGNPKAPLSADRVDWLAYHPRRWVNGSPAPGPV
ncbi:MAG: signal peptidase I, partial [Pirellulales bacterium]|nr:signal peptidase I [Pirellulales bacterium]